MLEISHNTIRNNQNDGADDVHDIHMNGKYDTHIFVHQSPFRNCQTFSIGEAGSLLSFPDEDIVTTVNYIRKITQKDQMIIDVYDNSYNKKIEALFNIVGKLPYINLTGNSMVIYLLRLK